jgi:hypothetical protein
VLESDAQARDRRHELLDRVSTGRAAGWAIERPDLVADAIARHGLEGEQAEMVRSLTSTGDAIQVVRAPAGTGKTRALEVAREAWTRSGADVIGCALSARAAAELRDQAARETSSVRSMLAVVYARSPVRRWTGTALGLASSASAAASRPAVRAPSRWAAASACRTSRRVKVGAWRVRSSKDTTLSA